MSRNRRLGCLFILISAVLAWSILVLAGVAVHNALAAPPTKCQEDQRCWNWVTMGNGKRGIVSMWGTPLVVGPKRFCRMMRNGNIDIRGDHMRGDRTAMRYC